MVYLPAVEVNKQKSIPELLKMAACLCHYPHGRIRIIVVLETVQNARSLNKLSTATTAVQLQLTECVAMETQSGVSTHGQQSSTSRLKIIPPANLAGLFSSSSRETFFPPRVHVNL